MPVWIRNPTFETESPVTAAISRYLSPCWNLRRMTSCWFAERRESACARSDPRPAEAGGPRGRLLVGSRSGRAAPRRAPCARRRPPGCGRRCRARSRGRRRAPGGPGGRGAGTCPGRRRGRGRRPARCATRTGSGEARSARPRPRSRPRGRLSGIRRRPCRLRYRDDGRRSGFLDRDLQNLGREERVAGLHRDSDLAQGGKNVAAWGLNLLQVSSTP